MAVLRRSMLGFAALNTNLQIHLDGILAAPAVTLAISKVFTLIDHNRPALGEVSNRWRLKVLTPLAWQDDEKTMRRI